MSNLEHLIENGLIAMEHCGGYDNWHDHIKDDPNWDNVLVNIEDLWIICQYVIYTWCPMRCEECKGIDCVECKHEDSDVCDDCIWHVCNYNKVDWDGEDGYISRHDAVNEIHKYFIEEIENTPTEIDEDGDEVYIDIVTVNSLLAHNKHLSKRIKALPSAKIIK